MGGPVPEILVITDQVPERIDVCASLQAAGLSTRSCGFAVSEILAQVKQQAPGAVIAVCELTHEPLQQLLTLLQRSQGGAQVPVFLVAAASAGQERIWLESFRGGLAGIFNKPFRGAESVRQLQSTLAGLSRRNDIIEFAGSGSEAAAIVHLLMRTVRSGTLRAESASGTVEALFERGVLKSANGLGKTGHQAIAALRPLTQVSVRFASAGAVVVAEPMPSLTQSGTLPMDAVVRNVLNGPPPQPMRDEPLVVGALADDGTDKTSEVDLPALELIGLPPPPAPAPASAPSSPSGKSEAIKEGDKWQWAASTPVLFVDDDDMIRKMFATFFQKAGYPVSVAADGLEAVNLILEQPFELVVADLNMPRLDGWGLLKALRDDYRTIEIPVALFSAHDDYRESLRAMHAGAQAYYPKSLRLKNLELQVRELLEPRLRFMRLLEQQASVNIQLGPVGPQWMLRQLAKAGTTCQVDAVDAWAVYRLHISGGVLMTAHAQSGANAFTGERALMAFLASKGAEVTMLFGGKPMASQFAYGDTRRIVDGVVQTMNDEQAKAKDGQVMNARQVRVNAELYKLYTHVGPPAWMQVVQMICEHNLLPAQIVQQTQIGVGDLSAIVRDLVRRNVIQLS